MKFVTTKELMDYIAQEPEILRMKPKPSNDVWDRCVKEAEETVEGLLDMGLLPPLKEFRGVAKTSMCLEVMYNICRAMNKPRPAIFGIVYRKHLEGIINRMHNKKFDEDAEDPIRRMRSEIKREIEASTFAKLQKQIRESMEADKRRANPPLEVTGVLVRPTITVTNSEW